MRPSLMRCPFPIGGPGLVFVLADDVDEDRRGIEAHFPLTSIAQFVYRWGVRTPARYLVQTPGAADIVMTRAPAAGLGLGLGPMGICQGGGWGPSAGQVPVEVHQDDLDLSGDRWLRLGRVSLEMGARKMPGFPDAYDCTAAVRVVRPWDPTPLTLFIPDRRLDVGRRAIDEYLFPPWGYNVHNFLDLVDRVLATTDPEPESPPPPPPAPPPSPTAPPASLEAALVCPICMSRLASPVGTDCGHTFCRACLSSAMRGESTAPCPICRAPTRLNSVNLALRDVLEWSR